MAFEAKIKVKQYTAAADEIHLIDITGNYGDTGYVLQEDGVTYQPVTNETGYGSENAVELSSHARVITCNFRHPTTREIVLPLGYLANDPQVELFGFPLPAAGVLEFVLYLIPIDIGQGTNIGDILFVPDISQEGYGGRIEEVVGSGRVVLSAEDLGAKNLIKSPTLYVPAWPPAQKAYNDLDKKFEQLKGTGECDDALMREVLMEIIKLREAFMSSFCATNYSIAAKKISKLDEIVEKFCV